MVKDPLITGTRYISCDKAEARVRDAHHTLSLHLICELEEEYTMMTCTG